MTEQTRQVTVHPYPEGETVCNLFNKNDCTQVEGGSFDVSLNNGEVKILYPNGSFV
jgi:hypothetical protein